MMKTVLLGSNEYEMEQNETEINLKRYDIKHKIWVRLSFPKDGEDNTQELIDTLIRLYIERQLKII